MVEACVSRRITTLSNCRERLFSNNKRLSLECFLLLVICLTRLLRNSISVIRAGVGFYSDSHWRLKIQYTMPWYLIVLHVLHVAVLTQPIDKYDLRPLLSLSRPDFPPSLALPSPCSHSVVQRPPQFSPEPFYQSFHHPHQLDQQLFYPSSPQKWA